ncbi:MAG: hypothetical protein KAG66_11815, partial [Methylococcales bacterium]|nr:hypothetical protein [Methylococcales bacterium]
MDDCVVKPSAALLEANRRLLALRAVNSHQSTVSSEQLGKSSLLTDDCSLLTDLPSHLGWGSDRLTAVTRRNQQTRTKPQGAHPHLSKPAVNKQQSTANNQQSTTVRLYPDIGLGMLRGKATAVGRIWLLLRHLDKTGQGWVSVEQARQHLTKKGAATHVCGWRQLRNLLKAGQGTFWQRDATRIWLRSTLHVAAGLGVERLNGRPVALPVKTLTSHVSDVRAHFYASFHSGKKGDGKPIARETLAKISGVSPHSQRNYEKRSRVAVQQHIAIGAPINSDQMETQAWRRGNALFKFNDKQGKQGKPGTVYLAWQLPNSYVGPHSHCPKGRQKRLNRDLA